MGITNAPKKLRAELLTYGLKLCPRCNPPQVKPVNEFHRNKRASDGLCLYCKQCYRTYNKEHRDEKHKYMQAYHKEHRDERRKYNRIYDRRHSDEKHKYMREYNQTARGRKVNRATSHRRRMRKLGLRCDLTIIQWKHALEYFNHCCAYCGKQPKLSEQLVQEHYIPVSLSGGYTQNNIIPACKRCNNSKYVQLVEDWILRVDFVLDDALEHITQYFELVKGEVR